MKIFVKYSEMVNRIKQFIINLARYLRNFYVLLKIWIEFILDLYYFSGTDFFLFSNQAWHYGWDYENRKKRYKKIFSEEANCICVDLNNKSMVYILKYFLTKKVTSKNYIFSEINTNEGKEEIFFRNLWDVANNSKTSLLYTNSSNYLNSYLQWSKIRINSVKNMISSGDKLFNHSAFKGLIVSQFGYEDWAWTSLCLLNNKPVYSPEATFGFTKLTGQIESKEANFIIEESKKISYSNIKAGINSLKARCVGNFAHSSLSYYMSDFTENKCQNISYHECSYVFYLHAFGDSANNTISNYSNSFGIDYFHSTMKILEEFEKRKKNIYIKLHPLSKTYNYDRLCLNALNKFVESSNHVRYCKEFALCSFKEYFPNASIITGRGSIISEASFLGINSYSFCRSIYTELGISLFFSDIDQIFEKNGFSNKEFKNIKNWAIKLEAVRIKKSGSSIYSLSNYNKESKLINQNDSLVGFLNSTRIVNL